MKFFIDTDTIKENGISVQGFGMLFSLYNGEKLKSNEDLIDELNQKGLIMQYGAKEYLHNPIEISRNGAEMFEGIILDGEYRKNKKENRFNILADKLRELYPEGRKEGTNYYWRDSTKIIARKLKALDKKYGIDFTDEQAINATKRYIDSFNGNYTYMQLLKYFIMKNVLKDGELEETSQLLSYIENEDQVNNTNTDWSVQLK